MPALDSIALSGPVKLLIVGDSGSGKTGSLASLVDAGYKLRILDFEEGIDPLSGFIKTKELRKNVSVHQLKDEFRIAGTNIAIKRAPAFQTGMGLLNDWKEPDGTLGPIQSWGLDTIFVLDTLGSFSKSSLNMVLQANARLIGNPEIQHYGTAMDNVEKAIDMLTNKHLVPCHVVVLAHLAYVEEKDAKGQPYPAKAFPETVGSKLNPKIGRKFNNLISLSRNGTARSFKTKQDGLVSCKTAVAIQDKYPIETGLAEIFRDLQGSKSLGPA